MHQLHPLTCTCRCHPLRPWHSYRHIALQHSRSQRRSPGSLEKCWTSRKLRVFFGPDELLRWFGARILLIYSYRYWYYMILSFKEHSLHFLIRVASWSFSAGILSCSKSTTLTSIRGTGNHFMTSEVRDDPLKAQQIPTKTKLVLQTSPRFYLFLLHIWNGNAGLKCTFRAPKESHQVSIKSGAVPINMDCMLGFLLSYLSFLQEVLSWMMDIFAFLEWTEFQAEALLMNLLRSAWEPGDIWEPCGH